MSPTIVEIPPRNYITNKRLVLLTRQFRFLDSLIVDSDENITTETFNLFFQRCTSVKRLQIKSCPNILDSNLSCIGAYCSELLGIVISKSKILII